jgi:hypothetical protein
VEESIRRVSEREPVQVPADVLEGLEAVRCHLGHAVLDVATIRYFANERGRRTPAQNRQETSYPS